jgi:hypothetical protein
MNTPETPSPQQPAGGSSSPARPFFLIAALVVVIAAVGMYFVGRAVGEDKGRDDAHAEYEPGKPKYHAIYRAGQQAGEATGQREGEEQGATKGRKAGLEQGKQRGIDEGQVEGANSVFDAYSSWEVGAYYIVQIGEGQSGVDYALENRTQLAANKQYKLCQDDPSEVCVVNVASGG